MRLNDSNGSPHQDDHESNGDGQDFRDPHDSHNPYDFHESDDEGPKSKWGITWGESKPKRRKRKQSNTYAPDPIPEHAPEPDHEKPQ